MRPPPPTDRYQGQRRSLRENLSSEQFQGFLTDVKRDGWRQAISEYVSKGLIKYNYVINDGRADWRFLLPITSESVVVDAGCGWGTMAFPLSQDCRLVYALDVVSDRLQFIRLRSEQDGIHNIIPLRIILPRLPLATHCCDVVILSGVLEWLGFSDLDRRPIAIQQATLREVHRILRPGGCLYIGIENRFGAKYLLGSPEDHTRMRFVGVVPRAVGNWISLWRKGEPLRVHTPSYPTLLQMLKKSGFTDPDFLSPLPDYKVLRTVLSTASPAPLRFYFNNMRLATYQTPKQRLLAWLWPRLFASRQVWLTNSFSVIAYKK